MATVEAIHEVFKRIDILVNNVAISDNKNILDIDLITWQKTLDITPDRPFYFAKCVAHKMVDQGIAGNIVNVSRRPATLVVAERLRMPQLRVG